MHKCHLVEPACNKTFTPTFRRIRDESRQVEVFPHLDKNDTIAIMPPLAIVFFIYFLLDICYYMGIFGCLYFWIEGTITGLKIVLLRVCRREKCRRRSKTYRTPPRPVPCELNLDKATHSNTKYHQGSSNEVKFRLTWLAVGWGWCPWFPESRLGGQRKALLW